MTLDQFLKLAEMLICVGLILWINHQSRKEAKEAGRTETAIDLAGFVMEYRGSKDPIDFTLAFLRENRLLGLGYKNLGKKTNAS